MKKIFIIISSLLAINSFAQDKTPCEPLFNDFEDYYKNEFDEKAFLTEQGREKTISIIQSTTKKCPDYNRNLYVFGEEMLVQIITPMNLGEMRQKWTQYLTELYDQYGQYFPETQKENALKKIIALYKNGASSSEQTYKSLEQLYNSDKQIFSAEAMLIYADMVASKGLTHQNLSTEYIQKTDELDISIKAKISELEKKKYDANEKEKIKINNDIASLHIASKNISNGLKIANINCEAWNNLYKEEFDKNTSNVFWLQNALSRLSTYKCSINNEFFNKMAASYYDLEKNSVSAFYMGNIAQQQKNYKQAQDYFIESAELEKDKTEKAKLYYRIANLYNTKDKEPTKLYLEKAIENNPEMIESYILLSKLYTQADKSCFNNDFEYKSRFFLASNTLEKIIKINPKYKPAAEGLITSYLKNAPSKDEVKKAKMQGKTINFGCWINQQIIVP